MKILLDDADMDAQLQRTLIAAQAQSADLSCSVAVASRVTASLSVFF